MKKIVVVGNGGFAKEVVWLIERINAVYPTWDFLGFIDCDTNAKSVIGNDDFLVNYQEDIFVAVAIGSSDVRKKITEKYKINSHIHFPNLFDPSVMVSKSIVYGEGNIICAGVILTVDIKIGNFNIINLDCTIGHDVTIDDFVTLNPSVNVSGNTIIESISNIGTGTHIIQGLRIGYNSILGAGAVVVKDIPPKCTAVGNPAKPIKFFE